MNITINPLGGIRLLDYRVELISPPQPFYHTAIQLTGAFGSIVLTKIDLRNCTIWIADYNVTESITLNGFVNEMLYQVYFPIPPAFDFSESVLQNGELPPVYLTVTDSHSIQLPVDNLRMLFIHYTRQYFNGNGSGIHENLLDIFRPAPIEKISPLQLNAATVSVMRQIMFASPANRIVHLYLEAKVKELLVLLYQLTNPETPANTLSEKEIEILQKVRNIIMSDLSRSYNSYELSDLTGTNAYTLKTNFKTWFGIPLHHFLHNCRMEKATELLMQPHLSVKQIAFQVGYKKCFQLL